MDLVKVIKCFCEFIEERNGIMTEDNIRYYWFAAMLKDSGIFDLNNYTLEYPYPTAPKGHKKELDFLYLNDNDSFCMEIKFHRHNESKSAYAHTDAAGSIINDLQRLQKFELESAISAPRKFFLYVTDDEMHQYLSKGDKNYSFRQELKRLYMCPVGGIISNLFEGLSITKGTFFNSATASYTNKSLSNTPAVQLLFSRDLDVLSESFKQVNNQRKCYIRLYEIM